MRPKPTAFVEKHRVTDPGFGRFATDKSLGNNGLFTIPYCSELLKIVVSNIGGWDHVSISVIDKKRTPSWEEMCYVKNLFWEVEETVIQYHPPLSQYKNCHPYVLHLWKKHGFEIPLPPRDYV